MDDGRLVEVADTRLFVSERGRQEGFPLVVLHGGPGLDHHMFADYLDPIAAATRYRLILVDERAQGRSDRIRRTRNPDHRADGRRRQRPGRGARTLGLRRA